MRKPIIALWSLCLILMAALPAFAQGSDSTVGFVERPEAASTPDATGAKRHQQLATLAYERGDYAEALRHYQHVYITYPNASVLYNMALCYTQMERLHEAILHYEQALLLEPTMTEARHNLRLLYATTKDGLGDGRALVVLDDLCYSWSGRSIAAFTLLFFILAATCALVFRLSNTPMRRRIAFYSMLFMGALWLFTLAMLAHQWYYQQVAERRAIILDKQELRTAPDPRAESIITLHEGTAVLLEDNNDSAWQEVSLADGRTGWLPKGAYTSVVPEQTIGNN